MAERGPSKLFHAIVVAGAALGGACSGALPSGRDAAAETSRDRPGGSEVIVIDASPRDEAAPDAVCENPQFHQCTTVSDCWICGCVCPQIADAGGGCFPCYI